MKLNTYEVGLVVAGLELLHDNFVTLSEDDAPENRAAWASQADDVTKLIKKVERESA